MILRATVRLLLAFVALADTEDRVTIARFNAMVDKLVGRLFDRSPEAWRMHPSDLDNVALHKPSRLATFTRQRPTRPVVSYNTREGYVRSQAAPFMRPVNPEFAASHSRRFPHTVTSLQRPLSHNLRLRAAVSNKELQSYRKFEGMNQAGINMSATVGANYSVELALQVSGLQKADVPFGNETYDLQIHWADLGKNGVWKRPSKPPTNAKPFGDGIAMRTPLDNDGRAVMTFPFLQVPERIAFAVVAESNGDEHWLRARNGNDFVADLKDVVKESKKFVVSEGQTHISGIGDVRWHIVSNSEGTAIFFHIHNQIPESAKMYLHWGICPEAGGEWIEPQVVPKNAERFGDGGALRTLMKPDSDTVLRFPTEVPDGIGFVIYVEDAGHEQWITPKDGGDFLIPLKGLPKWTPDTTFLNAIEKGKGSKHWVVSESASGVRQTTDVDWHIESKSDEVEVIFEAATTIPKNAITYLHWGVCSDAGGDWQELEVTPARTESFGDGNAMRTVLDSHKPTILRFPTSALPDAIGFVLYVQDSDREYWLNAVDGGDFRISLNKLKPKKKESAKAKSDTDTVALPPAEKDVKKDKDLKKKCGERTRKVFGARS
eukprot:gnl/TRDRNA2_/TRDRNA2_165660_c0_seq2.p1 gnl/TRDRNA2_/TRDRNA2_165660_c0~~gnl/TRDRNA2_/TRDRNA2_165660_c0_seq2.p1  ORF type:complete len:603 (-),score=70.88 gnl/TRDRNA2_/TRDRNA2_165660_c0_seq2:1268-3076(-)